MLRHTPGFCVVMVWEDGSDMVSVSRMLVSFSLKKLSKRIGSSFAVATGNGGLSERPSSLADRRKMDLLSFSIEENFAEISEFLAAAISLR